MSWNLLHIELKSHCSKHENEILFCKLIATFPPKGSPLKACVVCKMQTCRCRTSRQHHTPTSVEPAWCSPCSTTFTTSTSSTPPLFHWLHYFISQANYRKKNRRKPQGALTYSLVAIRSRLKSADVAAVRKGRKKKIPMARNASWKYCVGCVSANVPYRLVDATMVLLIWDKYRPAVPIWPPVGFSLPVIFWGLSKRRQ